MPRLVIAYLGDAVLGLAGSTRRWQYRPWMVVLFGVDVIPLGLVSAVLVVLQATVVGYWCFWCLVSAAISLILIYWAYDEVWSSLAYLRRVWRRTHSAREVWSVFWGRFSPEGGRDGSIDCVRPTLEVVAIEPPAHLRRRVDSATGLPLLDLQA